ncbi:hypothetical protein FHX42_004886 [Saccharopolyspora lacisalsi]|uniref:Uncharacterized protein n=1 Tax=Halosaccharopolyspora lacisalsi TaxID=1000566 RepID=A0A839E371_9PSEU|nr:hypothetical protein [Halosaccharopolyspora lacisalsi]MBA8827490.1 hypothetical protein [Halosaccharopolyspora lacisalsi]
MVDDKLVAHFDDPTMYHWLDASLRSYRDMLRARIDEYREYDPLCEQLGLALPVTPLKRRLLNVLVDHWCGWTPDETLRQWMEADLMTRLLDDVELVLSTMPSDDEPLELRYAEQVEAWYWALLNMRIGYGVQHGVLGPGRPPIKEKVGPQADWDDPLTPVRFAVVWLDKVAHGLRRTSGQPLPEYTFD